MHRFFHPKIPSLSGETTLSSEESHHLLHVLRVKNGETITLVDGNGNVAVAEVVKAHAKGTEVRVLNLKTEAPSTRVHLAFALPKGPALDFIVRRCTEVGISSFQPLVTSHSLKKNAWNETRWHRVVAEVSKQCQAAWFPQLHSALYLEEWLASRDRRRTLFFCDENDRKVPVENGSNIQEADIVVGSEGGWNREEVEKLAAAGGKAFSLGVNRLRAETAALVATTLLKARLGEL